jgi:hypothetical protein
LVQHRRSVRASVEDCSSGRERLGTEGGKLGGDRADRLRLSGAGACVADAKLTTEDLSKPSLVRVTVSVWTGPPSAPADLADTPVRWVLGKSSFVKVRAGRSGLGWAIRSARRRENRRAVVERERGTLRPSELTLAKLAVALGMPMAPASERGTR